MDDEDLVSVVLKLLGYWDKPQKSSTKLKNVKGTPNTTTVN
jgi:hypothetical protein